VSLEAFEMKKLPLIGLIIGAIAAGFALLLRKKDEEPVTEDPGSAAGGAPPTA
jgi:hypothetical protein